VIGLALRSALAVVLLAVTIVTISVCWSGYRVTSAINHGALRAQVAMCMDVRHLNLREAGLVPQRIIDKALTQQIAAHYLRYRKRVLPYSALLLSSQTGWTTFWSVEERRQIYTELERRMPPCPAARARFLEIQAGKRRQSE
jgi:uncharacterized membrane protein (Fun14 family)